MGMIKTVSKKGILTGIIFLLTGAFLFGEDPMEDWRCSKEIKISGESKYKSVPLDPEVYRHAEENLSDLRIVDDKGDFVPFFIKTGFTESRESEEVFRTEKINTFEEWNNSRTKVDTSFDFQVIPIQGDGDSKDKTVSGTGLRLSIRDRDYSNQVEIYGRTEKGDWTLLLKDTIYDLDEMEKTSVKFGGLSSYPFFRVKIMDNSKKVSIDRCDLVSNSIEKQSKEYTKKTALIFSTEQKEEATILRIKNSDNLKLKSLVLKIDGNFDRQFELYPFEDFDGQTEKDLEDRYPFDRGNIYNFRHNDIDLNKTEIPLSNFPSEKEFYLRILNKDNKPLKIKEITALYVIDYLVFEETESKGYTLYFKNPEVEKPSYDIETFKKYIGKEKLDICSLGNLVMKDLPDKEKDGINFKVILNIFIVVAALVMVGLIILKLRKK